MNKNQKQIEEWLSSGVINQEQANKMLFDVNEKNKEEKSSKFIVAISLIGSVLLGVGVILFLASNWIYLSKVLKLGILFVGTFSTFYLGYLFKYGRENFPKVGSSLIFLSALLFGASIFLIAQIYNVQANASSLVLFWCLGVIPLVYGFKSVPSTVLSLILFSVWMFLFLFKDFSFFDEAYILTLPIIYLLLGTLIFGIGGLHYFISDFSSVARIIRLFGIRIAVFCLFILTFKIFSSDVFGISLPHILKEISAENPQLMTAIVSISIFSIIFTFINLFFNPSESKLNIFENIIVLTLIVPVLLFFFFPPTTIIYTIIFNLLFFGLMIFLIFRGYQREDISLVNTGFFYLAIFILVKYFDFFFGLLDRSLFFMVGGLILILGGIAMEKERRRIKSDFINK